MQKRYNIFVSGLVQGVSYRDFTKKCAMVLGIKGWVKNLPDGRVEIVAEGKEHELKELLAKLKVGTDNSSVEEVHENEEPPTGEFAGFQIIE